MLKPAAARSAARTALDLMMPARCTRAGFFSAQRSAPQSCVPWATYRIFITPQISVNPAAMLYVQEA
jgi:hypothetical protein